MQKRKIYSQDTINTLETEIRNLWEEKGKELTLDKVLSEYKPQIDKLIEIKCTAEEIAEVFNKAGIKASINKIKQFYFRTGNRNKPKISK